MNCRAQSRTAKFNREENLFASGIIQLTSDEEREGGKLKGVEVGVGREEMGWVACAEAVGEFRERETLTKERELYLSVVDGRKDIEDFGNLPHSFVDDVTGERDVARRE